MGKSICVLAILAAAISTAVLAKDQHYKKASVPLAATRMSDAEMDNVTAGYSVYNSAAGRYINSNAWRACGHGPIQCQ